MLTLAPFSLVAQRGTVANTSPSTSLLLCSSAATGQQTLDQDLVLLNTQRKQPWDSGLQCEDGVSSISKVGVFLLFEVSFPLKEIVREDSFDS